MQNSVQKAAPLFICLILFITVLVAVESGLFTDVDIAVNNFFASYQDSRAFYLGMLFITLLSSPLALLLFSVVIFIILIQLGMKRPAILFAFSVSIAFLTETFLKITVNRARPENAVLYSITSSFPSGHATVSTAFFAALLFILQNHKLLSKNMKKALLFVFSLIILLICLSRLFFHMHWLSDIIAGILLGLTVAFAFRYKL
ncbi:MAG: phosphatase PAP2 family protein [Candidatus Diapherotrites archaeon]|nr:phosphatase PAP2 family protein [Candidatus Diapherotrites archaeon]